MGKILYIIGNGFDRHHGLRSAYSHFGEYLAERDHETFQYLEEYLHCDEQDFWSTFENNLAQLNSQALLEFASESLVGYGAENWSDAFHHDYQYEIDLVVRALSTKLLTRFTEWINQIEVPLVAGLKGKLLSLDPSGRFLNFNYTSTLQTLYKIPAENILHIHGGPAGKKIILGHGWDPSKAKPDMHADPEDVDPRIIQGDDIIRGYFEKTFKATNQVVKLHREFFSSLKTIESIFIFGHSIGDVDLRYFSEIRRQASNAHWNVSYFEDLNPIREQVCRLGLSPKQVIFMSLGEYLR